MLDEARAIARALSGIQATMSWLELRGIKRSEVLRILSIAEAAGRDVSEGEIMQVLDATDTELANLRQKIALDRGMAVDEVSAVDMLEARGFTVEKTDAPEPAPEKATTSKKTTTKKADSKEPTPEEIKAALDKAAEDATKND